MHALLGSIDPASRDEIMSWWEEYEYEQTPEGRYVMAIDVLLPIFLNLAAGHDSSWSRHNVAAEDVRKRIDHVREIIPQMAELARQAVDEGVRQGLLR
jgi:hypothetical protein